jgi:N-acetylglucosaminyl-diphospho-decaprenol L-rhamnosyltransferase
METHMSTHRWTLVTVTFNSADALRTYWSMPPQDVRWIVVDNDSGDDTREVAASLGAEVIRLPKNVGFGKANNIGFGQSLTDFVAFVNPDVTVDFSSLCGFESRLLQSRCLLAPQLRNPDRSLQPNGRGFPLVVNKLKNRTSKAEEVGERYLRYAEDEEVRNVCWFIGAVVIGLRSTFAELGPWDERFFIYYEDSDICLRAWKAGFQCRVVGGADWVHGWARETTSFKWAPWKREIASMLRFYSRYPAFVGSNASATRAYPGISRAMGESDLLRNQ